MGMFDVGGSRLSENYSGSLVILYGMKGLSTEFRQGRRRRRSSSLATTELEQLKKA